MASIVRTFGNFLVLILTVSAAHAKAENASIFPSSDTVLGVYSHCSLDTYKYQYTDTDIPLERLGAHVKMHENVRTLELFHIYENAYYFVMESIEARLAGYASEPTPSSATELKSYLKVALSNDFASDMKVYDNDDSLLMKNFMLSVLYSIEQLQAHGHLSIEDLAFFRGELESRYQKIRSIPASKELDKFASCQVGENIFGCQNHSYGYAHVRALYGHSFEGHEDVEFGEAMFRFAIDDLSEDGALWREASRGAWSWKYTAIALGQLLSISEISRVSGSNVVEYRSPISGYTIHDAVNFYLRAIADPELMFRYAKVDAGVEHYAEYGDHTNLRFHELIVGDTEKSGAKNWFYLYRMLFPKHPNTKLGNELIPLFKMRSIDSSHMGFLAQCLYGGRPEDVALKNKNRQAQIATNALQGEKVGYERTRESLSVRFSCLLNAAKTMNLEGLPSEQEVRLMIDGLEGNTYSRTKRHLAKLGVSDSTMKSSRKLLLHLVNYEWGAEKYCATIDQTVQRLG
ncbi:MAG: hypothetical protein EBT94_08665 [Alphaproteobacteria bacterium]|nr:hypothetical protein [Alphaproteobacteria bacterium]